MKNKNLALVAVLFTISVIMAFANGPTPQVVIDTDQIIDGAVTILKTDGVAANDLSNVTPATGRAALGLGTISTKAATDYVATSSLAARVDTVNASFSGSVDVANNITSGGDVYAKGRDVFIVGDAGTYRTLHFRTGSSSRWQINADDSAESGGNVGSTLRINAFTDAGAYASTVLSIARSSGSIAMPGVYSTTSAGSANVEVSSTGLVTRTTSSRRYKTDIRDLPDNYLSVVDQLRPVLYKPINGPHKDFIGLIAEEIPCEELIMRDNKGRPDAVNYDRVAVLLLLKIRALEDRIRGLEQ